MASSATLWFRAMIAPGKRCVWSASAVTALVVLAAMLQGCAGSSDRVPPPRLPREAILAVMSPAEERVQSCIPAGRQGTPETPGKLVLDIQVEQDGRVESVRVRSSTLRDAEAETCVVELIRRLEFQPGHERVLITFPLHFAPRLSSAPCELGLDLAALLDAPGSVVIAGEMHGTVELPALVARTACVVAGAGHHLVVALELPATDAAAVDVLLRTGDAAPLLAGPFWSKVRDGRSSQAMLDLLRTIHTLRRAGAPLDLVLLDGGGEAREEVMAANLLASVRARPAARHLVLAGNIHARRVPGLPWRDPAFVPLAARVAREVPVLTLDVRMRSGAAWYCKETCGVHPVGRWSLGERGFVSVRPRAPESAYDGFTYLADVTPSPPAVAP